jgi:hypothetical protein
MIDEENTAEDHSVEAAAVLYDWFKHLTSLSLLTLGGVLSLIQGANDGEIKKSLLIVVLVFLISSGVLAFSGAGAVVGSRSTGTVLPSYIHKLSGAAAMALSMGIGAFVYVFVSVL